MQKSIYIFIFILVLQNYNLAARPIGQRGRSNSTAASQRQMDIRNYLAGQQQSNRQNQQEQVIQASQTEEITPTETSHEEAPERGQTRIDDFFPRR